MGFKKAIFDRKATMVIKSYLTILFAVMLLVALSPKPVLAIGQVPYIAAAYNEGDFKLADNENLADLYVDPNDYTAVKRAVGDLTQDIARVTAFGPTVVNAAEQLKSNAVIVGTIGKSAIIDQLISDGKLDAANVTGKWESFVIQVVANPLPNVSNALVIAGSDRRGTIFGIYDLSEQIGVSPWYWWADVTPKHKSTLIVKKGTYKQGEPSVQYRGIFINDERNFVTWSNLHMDTDKKVGPETYKKVFELLLRLKANYLWPAMHPYTDCFNKYPENNRLAAEDYGIVIGTSHCDMMLRNNMDEWGPFAAGEGLILPSEVTSDSQSAKEKAAYDYTVNPLSVYKYWDESAQAHGSDEAAWTIGMRGIHDTGFTAVNATTTEQKVNVLDQIVKDQRQILQNRVNPDLSKVLQVFIPYKEVLDLYNAGYKDKLPEDVCIMFCDDNHGYIRQLPDAAEKMRSGGAGVYYHISYLGPPHSYLWLNSQPLSLIQEQMYKAYENNAKRIWVLNVGDIKPGEIGIEFFLNLGWDVERWNNSNLGEFLAEWAQRKFGETYQNDISDIMMQYYQSANSRRPEFMGPNLFNTNNYGDEALKRQIKYAELASRAQHIYEALPTDLKDAFYQLVLFPVKCTYLQDQEFYYATKNYVAWQEDRQSSIINYATLTKQFDDAKKAEVEYYNNILAGGKWNGIMNPNPTSLPGIPAMPNLVLTPPTNPAKLGITVEGKATDGVNPVLNISGYTQDSRLIDIFNQGGNSFGWSAAANESWIKLTKTSGTVIDEDRIWVSIDWNHAPAGDSTGIVTISGASETKTVTVKVSNPASPQRNEIDGYVEANGYVSIEAEHYYQKTPGSSSDWKVMEKLGRSGASVYSYPSTAASITSDIKTYSPVLHYKIFFFSTGTFPVTVYRVPTLNARGAVRYALSFDEGEPVVLEGANEMLGDGASAGLWSINTMENIEKLTTNLTITEPGYHVLKLWMVDPAIAIDKIVIDTGGVNESYFGPPESYNSVYNKNPQPLPAELPRSAPAVIAPTAPPATNWGAGKFVESGGKVSIEAEVATENSADASAISRSNHGWLLTTGSSGSSLQCFADDGSQWSDSATVSSISPELAYNISFATAGNYKVWVLMKATDDASDSLHVGLDGTHKFYKNLLVSSSNYNKFVWVNVGTINSITVGAHKLNLWAREDGIYIDKIYLTTGSETPSGTGAAMTREITTTLNIAGLASLVSLAQNALDNVQFGTQLGEYDPAAKDPFVAAIAAAQAVLGSAAATQNEIDAAQANLNTEITAFKAARVMSDGRYAYSVYDDFNQYQTTMPFWDITTDTGTVTLVTDAQDPAQKYVGIRRLQSGSGQTSIKNAFSSVTGKVIIKAKVRSDSLNFTSVPYIMNNQGTRAVCVAFDQGNIRAYEGGTLKTVQPYELGRWYDLEIVANTDTDKFDLKIDGVVMWQGKAFRNAVSDISVVQFYRDGSWTGDTYVDDVQVYREISLPPVFDAVDDQSVKEGEQLQFTVNATDPNGDTVTYTASGLPAGASFDPATKTFSWTPSVGQAGSYTVHFAASDGQLSGSMDVTITVTNANTAPVFDSIADKSVNEGELLQFTVNATDAEGDTLTYSASGLPEGASFNAATKTFSWTPNYSQAGTYTVTFVVNDGKISASKDVRITVTNANTAPVFDSIADKSVNEGELLQFTVNATDAEGDTLTYSASGLPAGASFNAATKTFDWTPSLSQVGSYTVHFVVSDGKLNDSKDVVITVAATLTDSATLISEDIPDTMIAGNTYTVHLTVKNTGTSTWTKAGGYKLGAVNDSDPFTAARHALGDADTIASGQTKTFTITMKAPTKPGQYTTDWQMLHGAQWFKTSALVTQSVTVRNGDDATLVSEDIPATMTAGQSYTVHITVRNTGGTTWTASNRYKLGAVGETDPFALSRIHLDASDSIAPGSEKTFTFTMKAPLKAGSYITDWRMIQERTTWFGPVLVRKAVTVKAGSGATSTTASPAASAPLNITRISLVESPAPVADETGAEIVNTTIPPVMIAGQSYTVSVTVKNTSDDTWTNAARFKFIPLADAGVFAPAQELDGNEAIAPGQEKTFSFTMIAPAVTGTYNVDWQMSQDEISWLGTKLTTDIEVKQ